MPSRVLVAEQIAPRGIEALKAAGLDVDERLDLDPDQLLEAVHDAAALIVRSATPVTAEVLAAAADLVVVGRAGIGLDNVDVAAATRRGVMVVNAPQSNVLSAAEHTIALLLAQARNVPQADRDLRGGSWNRSRWEGVELYGKTLGVVGLGRVGVLVAQRAHAFGMRARGLRPVRERRTRPPTGHPAAADAGGSRGRRRFPHRPLSPNAGDDRPHRPGRPRQGQADLAHREHRARRHRRRGGARRGAARGADRRRRARRVRRGADDRITVVRAGERGRHAAPRRIDRRGAGQSGADDRRAGCARAARRLRAVRGECCRQRGVRDSASVPPAGGAPRRALHGARRRRARHTRGDLRGRDRGLRLPRAHPRGAQVASSRRSSTSRCRS